MGKKYNPPHPDDILAFQKAVEGTKLLKQKQNKVRLKKNQCEQKVIKKLRRPSEDPIPMRETLELATVSRDETIQYKHPSISNKILRNLSKGQYNIDAMLDLHGMTVDQAEIAVNQFLQQCLRRHSRVALIIHGKGRRDSVPVLKNKLNHWLREMPVVLAFCSASTTHGSRGAIFVLLKEFLEEK